MKKLFFLFLVSVSCAGFAQKTEIDLAEDAKDWATLSSDEQHFLKHVLAFFAASDGIVNENLVVNCVKYFFKSNKFQNSSRLD